MTESEKKTISDQINSIDKREQLQSDPDEFYCEMNNNQLDNLFCTYNKLYQANLGQLTFGMSPAAMGSAYFSWLAQLAQSPGHLLSLAFYPAVHASDCATNLMSDDHVALGHDVRFHHDNWQSMPWRFYAESFLQVENWWRHATKAVPGLSKRVERMVSFSTRQQLDALSPSNFVLTNPDLFNETIRTNGLNILQGTEIAVDHLFKRLAGMPPPGAENFIPGRDVAITPGKVVFTNHLIELIQYSPTTIDVYKEPILIIPAWIMKYYILDLSPNNSLVKWLVSQGHTVFIVSWRNPDSSDRNLGMDDYYRQGAMSSLDVISSIIPDTQIHLMGYCLGGTLAMITAAAIAENVEDTRLKSLSLLAAQGDFTDAGDLMLFITESEISFLENMMWEKGYLDTKQMAGSFQMLRSYDLIWSKMVDDYMTGRQRGMIDLLAWNADATRMPYKMHSEYLQKLFLNNDFAEGHFRVEGELVAPNNVYLPVFAVSTEKDHVAPWRSVYKVHLLMNSDITFVLTSGGHNAGIVSEPNHEGRSYFINERKKDKPYLGPNRWLKKAEAKEGSWWLAWHEWLVGLSSPNRVSPPNLDPSLLDAPGTYVLQK